MTPCQVHKSRLKKQRNWHGNVGLGNVYSRTSGMLRFVAPTLAIAIWWLAGNDAGGTKMAV